MAVLALGAVGAAAGVAAAGSIVGFTALTVSTALTAASLGFSIGSMAGSLLFPRYQQEGSLLGDLTVSTSTYGATRTIVYGTMRVNGNIIWAQPLTLLNVKTSGKGNLFGAPPTKTYEYFATFAMALCQGPAAKVLRVWADNTVIYDATNGPNITIIPSTVEASPPLLAFTFYPGDEEQLPDPLIESFVGTGQAPANRGTCYVVFNQLPLINFGNRIPNLSFEVAMSTEEQYLHTDLTLLSGDANQFTGVWYSAIAIDQQRQVGYVVGTGGPGGDSGLRRFQISTMQEDRQSFASKIFLDGSTEAIVAVACAADGTIYALRGGFYAKGISRIDPNIMKETANFPSSPYPGGTGPSYMSTPVWLCPISVTSAAGIKNLIAVGSLFNALMIKVALIHWIILKR